VGGDATGAGAGAGEPSGLPAASVLGFGPLAVRCAAAAAMQAPSIVTNRMATTMKTPSFFDTAVPLSLECGVVSAGSTFRSERRAVNDQDHTSDGPNAHSAH